MIVLIFKNKNMKILKRKVNVGGRNGVIIFTKLFTTKKTLSNI